MEENFQTEQYCEVHLVGTIQNVPEVKLTKDGTKWAQIKVKIKSKDTAPFTVKIKLFNDNATEAVGIYHQYDLISVVGKCCLQRYTFKEQNFCDLDIFPSEIKKLQENFQLSEKIIMS